MKLSRVSLLSAAALVAQAVLGQPAFQVHAAEVAAAEMESQMKAGETTFKAACMACHQADGKGLPGAFPPLAGSDYLLKDKARAVATVVHGRTGPITVNGQKFDSVMPPMS